MGQNIKLEKIVDNYLKGECTPEELEEVLKILEDPYHNLALRPVLYEKWNRQEKEESIKLEGKDKLSILKNIHNNIQLNQINKSQPNDIIKSIKTISKFAAILIAGLLLGVLIQKYVYHKPLYYTSISPKGSVSQMILPNNTVVYLNSGSSLKHSSNNNSGICEVFLEGEAWFDVEKNKKKPFIVHTPFYSIKVLGTQFNVKAYETDEEIVTTLEEGSIEVIWDSSKKISQSIQLKPGQQLIYNQSSNSVRTKTVRTRLFTSWKENRLIFINMNLKELIVVLERKYGVEIEVSDNIILDYHYDGTIKNETIIQVLELLKETLPIRYKIEGQKVIITNNLEKDKYMRNL